MNLHLAASMLVIVVSSGQAATFTVINSADSGKGSPRSAVSLANASPPPNMITFDPAMTRTITLTTGQIHISQGVLRKNSIPLDLS